jgi:hypothetical protein
LTCGKANEASLSPFQLRSAEAIAESPSIRSGSETQETPERASLGVVKELPSTWTQRRENVLEVRGRTCGGAKSRRIEKATPRREEHEGRNATADLKST